MEDGQEDFAAKLTVIEWEANLVLGSAPERIAGTAHGAFAAKLLLIEREAVLVLEELPPGVMRDRLQHIVTVARLLRARLDVA